MANFDEMYDAAIALGEGGNVEAAVQKLEELLAQAPDHALAHNALGVLYSRLGNMEEAVKHAQRVCELEPDDSFSFVALSLICQKAGLIMEAEQASMTARQLQWSGGE